MKNKLVIDGAGRIVLPKPVRKRFNLHARSILSLTVEADAIVLRPVDDAPALVDEHGLLVHEGEPQADLLGALHDAREQRDREVAGETR